MDKVAEKPRPQSDSRPVDDVGVPFSRRSHVLFVARYILYKTVFLLRDVRDPKLRLFCYEIVYSLCQAMGRTPLRLAFLDIRKIVSVFGIFHLRPGTIDAACASPAFERPDVDRLLQEVHWAVRAGRRIVVADVGADLGTYTVSLGNHVGPGSNTLIVAFEPSMSSFELLERNIAANGLNAMTRTRRVALGDGSISTATLRFNANEPGSSGLRRSSPQVTGGVAEAVRVIEETVAVSTLDAQLADLPVLDLLVLKLDVEGYETTVLDGARGSIARAAESLLLVEDFVDPAVIAYLHRMGWTFVAKLTPYNSFWRYTRRG